MIRPMTLKYNGTTIINYDPSEKQWWITGFNPAYKDKLATQLTASFTVTFNSKEMYSDFYRVWGGRGWKSAGGLSVTYSF